MRPGLAKLRLATPGGYEYPRAFILGNLHQELGVSTIYSVGRARGFSRTSLDKVPLSPSGIARVGGVTSLPFQGTWPPKGRLKAPIHRVSESPLTGSPVSENVPSRQLGE